MTVYEEAKAVSHLLCRAAIGEASKTMLEETGETGDVLTLLAILLHGEVIPGAVAAQLKEQAAKINTA